MSEYNWVNSKSRKRDRLILRLFMGISAAFTCGFFVIIMSNIFTSREVIGDGFYTMSSNLILNHKFINNVNHVLSGVNVSISPIVIPKYLEELSSEDGLQLYMSQLSFQLSNLNRRVLNPKCSLQLPSRRQQYSLNEKNSKIEKIALKTLFAAFSRWADEHEYPYWITGVNLLGWEWDSKRLCWSNGLEVHVPANLLFDMAILNSTRFSDRYLLVENNQHFKNRDYEPGYNIDAVFMDLKTGFSIDIKGLVSNDMDNKVLNTKDMKSYDFDDIFPLVRTHLDGIPTWRPFNSTKILQDEFGEIAVQNRIYSVIHDFILGI